MAKPPSPRLKLATTSSVQDSGVLSALCAAFERGGGTAVEVRAVGTGAALRLGRRGAADAVVVHNAAYELQFVEAGHGVNRREFMTNDFVLVGPTQDPAGAARQETVFDAFAAIFRKGAPFLSRGDDSGTNLRELELWAAAAALPFGRPWYRLAEGGMIRCLQAASAGRAYTLADAGTFLAQSRELKPRLKILCADPRHLRNAYSVIAVNPARHPHVNYDAAMAFIAFLTGEEGQNAIAKFRHGPHPLFHPVWRPTPHKQAPGRSAVRGATKRSQGGRLGRIR